MIISIRYYNRLKHIICIYWFWFCNQNDWQPCDRRPWRIKGTERCLKERAKGSTFMYNALRLYFRRENEVRRYKTIHRLLHIKTYVCENKISSRRASNERPYGIVQTVAILRSGMICFLILQTVYTNWERRLAVRASNERPYRIVKTIAMPYTLIGVSICLI